MSSQPTQRVRRNASPSTKQGPMKATMQFGLMPRQGSPSRSNGRKVSPSSSPTPVWVPESHRIKTRRSPDNRASPERRSPNSPSAHKVERPKAVRPSAGNPIRRTGSLDTIAGPYLTGQWPKDVSQYTAVYTNVLGQQVVDKSTQTSDDLCEFTTDKKKKQSQQHIRSASLGNGDNLKELIKQRLNRAKEGSKQQECIKLRQSPVHGNHQALGQTQTANIPSSVPIKIPGAHIPKGVARTRSSVEGLNQEIERLVLKNVSGMEDDERTQEPAPDGHRAPIAELIGTRTVDTQTPAANDDYCRTPVGEDSSSGSGSRSQSISPSFPIIPGNMDTSPPPSRSDSSDSTTKDVDSKVDKDIETSLSPDFQMLKYSASPKPNKSYEFMRGPPDGCERAKIIDEPSSKVKPILKEHLMLYSITPSQEFKLSEGSAFCPMPQYTCLATTPAMRSPAPSVGHAGIESL